MAAGTTLCSEAPTLRWVDVAMQASVCGWCLRYVAAGLTDECKGCSRVRWCSSACRSAHAVEHGGACPIVKPLAAQGVAPDVDALLGFANAFFLPIRTVPAMRGMRTHANGSLTQRVPVLLLPPTLFCRPALSRGCWVRQRLGRLRK